MEELRGKLLHIYSQYAHHTEVIIVGNRAGLIALRDTINASFGKTNGIAASEVMVNDGEGYELMVVHNNMPWQSEFWSKLKTPYTADYCQVQEGAKSIYDYLEKYLK